MDNLTDHQKKRYELLTKIQEMVAADFSDKDIALALGISSRTVRRNKHCDPNRYCCLNMLLQRYPTIKTEFLN